MASVALLTSAVGAILFGYIADKLGRRRIYGYEPGRPGPRTIGAGPLRGQLTGMAASRRLMPSDPMLNSRMAGSWLLALVLMMARDRLMAPWSRW
jgi:MFS family permease